MSDHCHFSSYKGHKERRTGKIRGAFSRMRRALGRLDADSRAGFTSSRPPPPWTSIFRFSLFLYKMCGLEKLGLVDQNWLERNLSALLLRTLIVGRRQQFESIEAALDMNEVRRFDEPF